ncbi:MAG: cation:proton antiporter, partial [Gaiellaceae bacterium]
MDVSFGGLFVVAAIAFTAPLLLGLAPGLRLPAVVLEIVAGIVIGPSGFGWVEVDEPLEVMALVGLAFLLLLAGLEVDVDRFRGRLLRVSA